MSPRRWTIRWNGASLLPHRILAVSVLSRRNPPFRLSGTRQDRDPARAQRRPWRVMASKTKVTPQKEEVPEKEGPKTPTDSPLLDLSDAAVKTLMRGAKKRGYVTHDQINSLSKEVNSEQIEDVLAMFSDRPEEEEDERGEIVEVHRPAPAKLEKPEPSERTDDPVRMYLREMGSVELLSREGEI